MTLRATGRAMMAATLAALIGASAFAADPLADGFADPPASARPRVWWHWMSGNVTTQGVTADLAWMKSVGIGGVQNFDVDLGGPQIVPDRLAYMTPAWQQVFAHAVRLADRSGLEFAIASSPGWSETGGPWVAPDDAMKKLVWSETDVAGGRRWQGVLPSPPRITGPFQDIAYSDPLAAATGAPPAAAPHYADVAVLAWPTGKPEIRVVPAAAAGSGEVLDAAALADDRLNTVVSVRRHADAPVTVLLTYARPVTARSATLFIPGAISPFAPPAFLPVLEARVDGRWQRLADLAIDSVPTTGSFAPVRAREFRLVLQSLPAPPTLAMMTAAPGAIVEDIVPAAPTDAPVRIAMLQLRDVSRVAQFEQKAGFAVAQDYDALEASGPVEEAGVDPAQVIDLTGRMKPDGSLAWTPPPGRWRVLRLGWSLTGTTNHPAVPQATGLEVDKYDGAAVRRYLETYLRGYENAVGAGLMGGHGINALLTDSTEVGPSNWTPRLLQRFRELRGYDPRPWLPTLTGAIIGSRARSDAFLYDYRRTLAQLHATEHYGTIAAVAHERGMKVYGEALEAGRPTLGDDLAMRSKADVPMAALWTYKRDGAPRSTLLGDLKGASSVAHVYGQNLAAAESLTSAMAPWAFAPMDLRRFVDLEFAYGINRPVIHTSVHQPLDDRLPGLSLAIFGQYFNRHETWADMAKPWVDYLARSSFLLQQGHDVADVAYFYGEERPLTALYAERPPGDTPRQHAFDFVNADILQLLRVENGELVSPGGARYAALFLGGASQRMTLPTLRRLRELVDAGATLIGLAPQSMRGLQGDTREFHALVQALWDTDTRAVSHPGRVVPSGDADAALAALGVAADVEMRAVAPTSQPTPQVLFVHRRLPDAELYYLANREARPVDLQVSFRVAGRTPHRWDAITGRIEPLSFDQSGGRTRVPLALGPEESTFVVFRQPTTQIAMTIPPPELRPMADIDGTWNVTFQPGRGAPAGTQMARLASLSDNPDAAIRYFSGTATYRIGFDAPRAHAAGARVLLDLGQVGDVARVSVNGKQVGITWWPPHRVDVTDVLKSGRNVLEVQVTDLWVNRLIGDAQPGATRFTFTSLPTYRADAPLRSSGLIGPVHLLSVSPPRGP